MDVTESFLHHHDADHICRLSFGSHFALVLILILILHFDFDFDWWCLSFAIDLDLGIAPAPHQSQITRYHFDVRILLTHQISVTLLHRLAWLISSTHQSSLFPEHDMMQRSRWDANSFNGWSKPASVNVQLLISVDSHPSCSPASLLSHGKWQMGVGFGFGFGFGYESRIRIRIRLRSHINVFWSCHASVDLTFNCVTV